MEMEPIGVVRSPLTQAERDEWAGVTARIELDPRWVTRRPQGREDNALVVRGLDAIDGTPVLDVKPYFAAFDRVEAPKEPEWVARLMEGYS